MSEESQHIGISATINVVYQSDTNQPTTNPRTREEENIQVQTMTTPVSAQLVNPYHNAIDLSTAEGKKLYTKATSSLPIAKNTMEI